MLPQTLVTIELHSQRNKEMEKISSSERPCMKGLKDSKRVGWMVSLFVGLCKIG